MPSRVSVWINNGREPEVKGTPALLMSQQSVGRVFSEIVPTSWRASHQRIFSQVLCTLISLLLSLFISSPLFPPLSLSPSLTHSLFLLSAISVSLPLVPPSTAASAFHFLLLVSSFHGSDISYWSKPNNMCHNLQPGRGCRLAERTRAALARHARFETQALLPQDALPKKPKEACSSDA